MDQQLAKVAKEALKKQNYTVIRSLGKGAFSHVFSVYNSQHGPNIIYSVKCVNKRELSKKNYDTKYIQQEIQSLRNVSHNHVVKLINSVDEKGWIFIFMEYCDIGNLFNFQARRPQLIVPFDETLYIMHQILLGLRHLHKKHLIHRDIKAENVLLLTDKSQKNPYGYIIKICDLGFCRVDDDTASTFCGTSNYMAPEIYKKNFYSTKVDVWAVGVLMYRLIFGDFPFKGMLLDNDINAKCIGGFTLKNQKIKCHPLIPQEQIKNLADFFKKVFCVNPEERPTVKQILEFPLFLNCKNDGIIYSEETQSQQEENFELETANFIDRVYTQSIKKLKLIDSAQEKCLEYYMSKVKFEVLQMKQNKTEEDHGTMKKLIMQIEKRQKYEGKMIKQCENEQLLQAFRPKTKSFAQFKQPYRILVGAAFKNAHETIKDLEYRAKVKFEIFCLHLINRVFQKEHRKVLKSYFEWKAKTNKSLTLFQFNAFQEWVNQESTDNLNQTIERMNTTFYENSNNKPKK